VNRRPDGVILAAGYSSRMSRFKPLCPIGSELLIDRAARLLREGGVERIFAVTGHKRDLLEERLGVLDVFPLFNDRFDQGMYSSVRRAVRGLPADSPGFLMLPVDYPFVLAGTIKMLVGRFAETPADVIYPVWTDRKGHPPAIRSTLYGDILSGDGEGGLRKLLIDPRYSREYLSVGDEGILYDADTDAALDEMLTRFRDRVN
jgi:molybdenum cofactor cytidylyltransferase